MGVAYSVCQCLLWAMSSNDVARVGVSVIDAVEKQLRAVYSYELPQHAIEVNPSTLGRWDIDIPRGQLRDLWLLGHAQPHAAGEEAQESR